MRIPAAVAIVQAGAGASSTFGQQHMPGKLYLTLAASSLYPDGAHAAPIAAAAAPVAAAGFRVYVTLSPEPKLLLRVCCTQTTGGSAVMHTRLRQHPPLTQHNLAALRCTALCRAQESPAWPALVHACRAAGVRLALLNARMSSTAVLQWFTSQPRRPLLGRCPFYTSNSSVEYGGVV